MEFKVYRKGEFLCNLELHKNGAEWNPIDNNQIKAGDILESVTDGARLEVLQNSPSNYLRAAFKTKILE